MKSRTSIILGVVALGLAGFIYFFERHQPTTDELQDRGDRVLPGFDRDRVDRIVLGEGDERVELVRREVEGPDAAPRGAVGEWHIVHPRELPADPEEVDSLLSAVDWLERRRTVEGEGAAKAAKYGLADPRASILLRLRGRDVKLSAGGEAPGEALYLAVSTETDAVYVVDDELLEQISKSASDLRDKRLVELRSSEVEAVRVTGRFHAVERDGRWALETPQSIRADRRRVEDVIRDVERLRATRFVADDVAEGDLDRYGLASPRREITLRVRGQERAVTLRFGGPCEGESDEIHVTRLGSGTVACVADGVLASLGVEPETLRDLRPHGFEAEDLASISIARGDASLLLRRADGRWHLGAAGSGARDADDDAVGAFVDALREARADDVSSDLEGLGLAGEAGDDEVVVRLTPETGEVENLRFVVGTGAVHLRRADEGVALVLGGDVGETLAADELRFRARRILDESASDAQEVEVTADGARQLLRKDGTRWRLVEPIQLAADDVLVRDVVRDVARLEVERFVATAPAPEHGLARPRIRLRVRFAAGAAGEAGADAPADAGARGGEGTDRVLAIGAETDGGAFARLEGDDETVFVVGRSLVDRLGEPLLDRDVFSVEEDRVTGITLALGDAAPVVLERRGTAWRGPAGAPPEGAVDTLLARLAVARAAEVVGLGPAPAVAGLASPRATLTLRLEAEEGGEATDRTIVLGAEYGESSRRRIYARRADVDATYGLPLRAVRPILEWGAAAGDADAAAGDAGDSDAGGPGPLSED